MEKQSPATTNGIDQMRRFGFYSIVLTALSLSVCSASAQQVYDPQQYRPFSRQGTVPRVDMPSTAGVPLENERRGRWSRTPEPTPPVPPKTIPEAPKSIVKTVQPPVVAPVPQKREKTVYYPGMGIIGKAQLLDGQNMLVDGNSVRLDGIETPGLGQSCGTPSGTDWSCGKKAKDRLAAAIGGEKPSCTVVEALGNGASVVCSVRGINDLGQFLVAEGFAVPNFKGRKKYASAMTSAQISRAGIWIGRFENPESWRRKHK